MAEQLKGNAVIGQSGGPTAVINESLVGAILEAAEHPEIGKFYGARHGVKGIIDENFIDLKKQTTEVLQQIARTPSSALGSIRMKPTKEDCENIFKVCQKRDIRYFFYIGGNDSAETAHIINQMAHDAEYQLRVFHIPKTIDNDLREMDHTPGFGSAARFVTQAFMGVNEDNRSLPGIYVAVVMGRHAGFLTAAAALARTREDDGPHLIYLPERDFNFDSFVKDVENTYKKYGRCIAAVSEGIHLADGTAVLQALNASDEVDTHGNIQLSGTGALGDSLATIIKDKLKPILGEKLRVRADTFGYLQRSYFGIRSEIDAAEAREVGKLAVRWAVQKNVDGTVGIKRASTSPYKATFELMPLATVAKHTREMPDEFIDGTNNVTDAFIEYLTPLVGEIERPGRLEMTTID